VGKNFSPIAAGAAVLCLFLAGAVPSAAQQSKIAATAAAANPEYQALFKRMYADPSNLDVTFQFAELATKLGDYEAAIGALERMLFYNPNLPRVKLELGVLYYRIGGLEVARSYFEQAVATPGAPPDVQARVNEFLGQINSSLSPHKFGGYVHGGYRHQSNANAGPAGLFVRALGNDATLSSDAASAPDWNKYIVGGVTYSYEVDKSLAAEASLTGYYSKQDKLSKFDLGIVELQAGPRFALPGGMFSGASAKVYGILTKAILAEDPYYQGAGFGVSARGALEGIARFEPSYEYRDRQYKDSEFYPTASELTGKLHSLAMQIDGVLFTALPWSGRLAADWNRTDLPNTEFNSFDRLSADLGFPIAFSLPWWGDETRQAVFTPAAGVSRTRYLEPDPLVDPDVARLDKEWHVSASLDLQIYGNFGLRGQVYYTRTTSSLPNFVMDNLTFSLGPTARF
jgi:hypothetical protein